MKIAILGAGFTGLSAAYFLSKNNFGVDIFEKDSAVGGLAAGFRDKNWRWALEKHYHHWFTGDSEVLSLLKDLRLEKKLIIKRPVTATYRNGLISQLDSPLSFLSFPSLNPAEKLQAGLSLAYLKLLANDWKDLEKITAYKWLSRYFGKRPFEIIFKPLFEGKFQNFAPQVNLAWFWARIKKRTSSLMYYEGGFPSFAEDFSENLKKRGVEIILNKEVNGSRELGQYDKIIATLPTPAFVRLFPRLPSNYKNNLLSLNHLDALNLVLETKTPILKNEYWLNINDRGFPFIILAQHTNFIDKSYYNNHHLAYLGNYLPGNHQFFNFSAKQLVEKFMPYIKKINPEFDFSSIVNSWSFSGKSAQPIPLINHSHKIPRFETPIENVYLANMDMVYPWDRGTNYAVELGRKVAKYVSNKS